MEDRELLRYALEHGMIDVSHVQEQIELNKRKELLNRHPYKIWQGKDGNWRTYLPQDKRNRKLVKRISWKSLEDEIIDYWEKELQNPTVKEAFEEWNDRRLELKKISPSTHLRYIQDFNRFFRTFGNRRIKSISSADIEDFLDEQVATYNLTAKAFSNLKTILKGFLKRAKKRKLIDFNVESLFEDMDMSDKEFKVVIKEDYEEVFDEDEMPEVISYLSDNLDMLNMAILLIFVSGIRVGEAVTLKHSDFDDCTLKIRRTETRYKSGDKWIYEVKELPKTKAGVRTIVIPKEYEWLIKKIQLLNPFQEYIFLRNDGSRIYTHSIRHRLLRICKKLGIYEKSPHKIRKTYGSILLDNHVDNQMIIGQMGHTDILCTERHYHRNRKGIERKSEIISAIPEFMAQ